MPVQRLGRASYREPSQEGRHASKEHTEEEIVFALKQEENGEKVPDLCRKLGITETSFYRWKKQYVNLGVSELRELRLLREENTRLKQLASDLSLVKHFLQEVLSIIV